MVSRIITSLTFSVLAMTAVSFVACTSPDEQPKSEARPEELGDVAPPKAFNGTFSGSQITYQSTGFKTPDAVWALAQCGCAPQLLRAFFDDQAGAKGVLPQILIPTVREEVKNNRALQTLQRIPLGGLLANFFASDDKIADSIREGLAEKIARAPGGSTLSQRKVFRFDGFSPAAGETSVFSVADQIPRWAAVFAADGVWSNKQAVDGRDHGLQTLLALKTLSEWTYLIGLDKNSDGGFYGGLSLKATNGAATMQGPVDPRQDGVSWFVSGRYSLQYDDRNARELATSVKEVWTHRGDAVNLDEQARLWQTAALAFARLRTDNRASIQSLFSGGDEAVLPPETHTLPLAFLAGVEALLPNAFIDKDQRLIRAQASIGSGLNEPASALVTARLLRALTMWSETLETADKAGLDEASLKRVSGVPAEIKPAMQLAVQSILARYTAVAADAGGSYGLALTDGTAPLAAAPAAEILIALITAEQSHIQSPFLRERILMMLDWFAGDALAAVRVASDSDIVWLATLARVAQGYAQAEVAGWAPSLQAFADQQLAGSAP